MKYIKQNETKNIRIGDVYIVRFGGEGSEQSGCRPAVVLQNNTGNIYSPNVIVLPMTSVLKKVSQPTHVVVYARETGLKKDSMVLCENPECVSKERLGSYLTSLPEKYMRQISVGHLLATAALSFLDVDMLLSIQEQTARLNLCA